MLANHTKHAMVVTRSMSRALISSTATSRQEYRFQHVPDINQFRMYIDTKYAYIRYLKNDSVYDLVFTKVPKELEGQGIGKVLAEKTFDYIASHNSRMILTCDYLRHVAKKFGDKYKNIIEY